MCRALRRVWQQGLLLLLLQALAARHCAQAVVVTDDIAFIYTEQDLLNGLRNEAVHRLLVASDLKLTPEVWPTATMVTLERAITVTPAYVGYSYTIDARDVPFRVVLCFTTRCSITITGTITFLNPDPGAFDFATPVPGFFGAGRNGTMISDGVTVVSPSPLGLWNSSNLVYQPESRWWIGDLNISCLTPTEFLFDWFSLTSLRIKFLQPANTETYSGYVQLKNARMVLSPTFACVNYSAELCNNAVQICQGPLSTKPLPPDVCSPAKLPQACRPAPEFLPKSAGSTNPVPTSTSSPREVPGPSQGSSDKAQLWWVGLLLGLVLLVAVIVGSITVVLSRRRKQHQKAEQKQRSVQLGPTTTAASTNTSSGQTDVVFTDSTPPPDGAEPCVNMSIMPLTRAPTETKIHMPLPPVFRQDINPALPPWAGDLPPHDVANNTGFSYQSDFRDAYMPGSMSMQSSGKAVIIDMAPSSLTAIPQLKRNPLGLELQTLLGTGAYGTVYSGLWQGQRVAVKVVKHEVQDQEALDSLLQFKEAALGSELNHPRIVRTLASALVVQEELMNESGVLLRPGVVEAHIVSSLCDMGTLKAWTQQVWRAAAISSNPPGTSNTIGSSTQPPTPPCDIAKPAPCMMSKTMNLASVIAEVEEHQASRLASMQRMSVSQGPSPRPLLRRLGTAAPGTDSASADDVTRPNHFSAPNSCVPTTTSDIAPGQAHTSSQLEHLRSLGKQLQLPPAVYPSLACMPLHGPSGLRLHSNFNCHLLAVVDILLEVAEGLSYLLSKGVVHGDLKPQNCLLCSDCNSVRGFSVKICDFGISRVIHGSKSHTTVSKPPGTLAYFAPELLSTCHLSPSCDLYSFGIIMYELLSCKQPLASLSMAQVLYKKATGKIDEHLVYPPEAPEQYIQLATSCYSLEASSRPSLPDLSAQLLHIRSQALLDWSLPFPPPPPPSAPASSSQMIYSSQTSQTPSIIKPTSSGSSVRTTDEPSMRLTHGFPNERTL